MSVEVRPAIDLVDTASFAGGQPHEQFRWLREHDPVHKHPTASIGNGYFYALTKFEDVRAVGRDHRTYSNSAGGIQLEDLPADGLAMVRQMMLYMDPPEHHRYRRLVRDPFQPDGA